MMRSLFRYLRPVRILLAMVTPILGSLAVFGLSQPALAQATGDRADEIVYVDAAGVIRVLDPRPADIEVQWFSPAGEWRDVALGDFNNDGDHEIVAIGSEGGADKLVIYDPVVRAGVVPPNQAINGVPWDKLYERQIVGEPTLVAAGDFAPDRPGDEILFGKRLTPEQQGATRDVYQITLLRATDGQTNGRSWEPFVTQRFSYEWTWVRAGNLDNAGPDEVLLVDDDHSRLAIYRVDDGLTNPIYSHTSGARPWRAGVIGQFSAGDAGEVAAVRSAPLDLPSLVTFEYLNGTLVDLPQYSESLLPSPRIIFLADINGSGDQEIFMLRSMPANVTDRPHLFMRNPGNDAAAPFEVRLDSDSGYRAGAGGDLDGDGTDEVVVIRDVNCRIFWSPEIDTSSETRSCNTNQQSIAIADLDRGGSILTARMGASPTSLAAAVPQGTLSQAYPISLFNATSNRALPFSYSVNPATSWLQISTAESTTPATLNVTFNAAAWPPGTQSTTIEILSTDPFVTNLPLRIPVTMTVESPIVASPASIAFIYYPCPAQPESRTQPVTIQQPAGQPIVATLVADETSLAPVTWVEATPITSTAPSTVYLTTVPAALTGVTTAQAALILEEAGNTLPALRRVIPVSMLCAQGQLLLPVVAR